jgi:hypothetical protein
MSRRLDRWIASTRLSDGGQRSSFIFGAALPTYYARLERRGSQVSSFHSVDGVVWDEHITSYFTQSLGDSVLVGIPLTSGTVSSNGFVDVEWFRATRLATEEPEVHLSLVREPGAL